MLCKTVLATAFLSQAWAAPRPAPAVFPRLHKNEGRQAPPEFADAAPTATPYGPSGASGSLRGPKSLVGYNPSFPVNTELPGQIPVGQYQLAEGQSEDPDLGLYLDLSEVENPQPIRGGTDAPTDPGPRNKEIEIQNSDLYAPPGTDSGDVPNAKWPLGRWSICISCCIDTKTDTDMLLQLSPTIATDSRAPAGQGNKTLMFSPSPRILQV